MNPELITKWRQQKEELKDFHFTKSLMESNAYDFTVKAHNFEEALEIAKGNCPVYSDKCMWGGYWDMRYAEGGGHEVLSWGKHSKEESLHLKPEEDMFAVDLHNELLAFVRKFASRNEYGQFVNRNMDVSGYDKLADICEEAENILINNG